MFIELGRAKAGSESGLVATTFMGFVSGKGRNDVMSGCSRELQKFWLSWRAGRRRASQPGDVHHDVKRRSNPHSLVLR